MTIIPLSHPHPRENQPDWDWWDPSRWIHCEFHHQSRLVPSSLVVPINHYTIFTYIYMHIYIYTQDITYTYTLTFHWTMKLSPKLSPGGSAWSLEVRQGPRGHRWQSPEALRAGLGGSVAGRFCPFLGPKLMAVFTVGKTMATQGKIMGRYRKSWEHMTSMEQIMGKWALKWENQWKISMEHINGKSWGIPYGWRVD